MRLGVLALLTAVLAPCTVLAGPAPGLVVLTIVLVVALVDAAFA